MSKQKFMEACLAGDVLYEQIDDFFVEWHKSGSNESVYEFLGMTEEEYGLWVENDLILKSIFYARKIGISIREFIEKDSGQSLAARASSREEAEFVQKWLKRTGRV